MVAATLPIVSITPGAFTIPGGNPVIVAVVLPMFPGWAGIPVITVGPVLVMPAPARIAKSAVVPSSLSDLQRRRSNLETIGISRA